MTRKRKIALMAGRFNTNLVGLLLSMLTVKLVVAATACESCCPFEGGTGQKTHAYGSRSVQERSSVG
jgi:hypothetical protein